MSLDDLESGELPRMEETLLPSYSSSDLPHAAEAGLLIRIGDATEGDTIAFADGSAWVELARRDNADAASWGSITGTLSDQTDLQNALDGKVPTTRTLTGGDGIATIGDLSADRTIALDVNGLTAEATVDGANDYVAMYDASALAHRKVLVSNIGGGSVDETADYNWTGTHNFGNTTRVSGSAGAPTSGAGLELKYDATPEGRIVAYDRDVSAFKPLSIGASLIKLEAPVDVSGVLDLRSNNIKGVTRLILQQGAHFIDRGTDSWGIRYANNEYACYGNQNGAFYARYNNSNKLNTKSGGAHTNGEHEATSFNATSSIRWKENLQEIDPADALAAFMQLQPRYFDWKDEHLEDGIEKHSVGLIAEQVAQVMPLAANKELDHHARPTGEYSGVDFGRIAPYHILVTQEQERRIRVLEARVRELEHGAV